MPIILILALETVRLDNPKLKDRALSSGPRTTQVTKRDSLKKQNISTRSKTHSTCVVHKSSSYLTMFGWVCTLWSRAVVFFPPPLWVPGIEGKSFPCQRVPLTAKSSHWVFFALWDKVSLDRPGYSSGLNLMSTRITGLVHHRELISISNKVLTLTLQIGDYLEKPGV